MKLVTGLRRDFEARLRQRGSSLEQAKPCIVSEDGALVTVDVEHADYPKPTRPPYPIPDDYDPRRERGGCCSPPSKD
jgi:hypothetical protein